MKLFGIASALGLLGLAACTGGGGAAAMGTPAPTCSANGTTFTLVNPAPGSTVSAPNTTAVTVSASGVPAGSVYLILVDQNGVTQSGSPLAGGNPYTSSGFVLTSSDKYTVEFGNLAQSGCAAAVIPGATFSS